MGPSACQYICQRPSCPAPSREGVTLHGNRNAVEPSPPRAAVCHHRGERGEGHFLGGNGATALPGLQTPSVGHSVHFLISTQNYMPTSSEETQLPLTPDALHSAGALGDSCRVPCFRLRSPEKGAP